MKKNALVIKNSILSMGGIIEEFLPERGCFYIQLQGKRILIHTKFSLARQSFITGSETECKDITHRLLCESGLPSPDTLCFYKKTYNRKDCLAQLKTLTYPIILKDAQGSNSRGVFPCIGNPKSAIKTLEKELPLYKSMVAQRMLYGKEYRVLVLDEKVIGALEMIIPNITGDNKSTVQELIKKKQKKTRVKTFFDNALAKTLKRQGVALGTIPSKSQVIYFKDNSSLAEGGETRNVTALVGTGVERICVESSKAVGKYLVGIDIICEDIHKDPKDQLFNILEINGMPDLDIHYNPTHGKTRDVVKNIVSFMVEAS